GVLHGQGSFARAPILADIRALDLPDQQSRLPSLADLEQPISRHPRDLEGVADQPATGTHLGLRLGSESRHRHRREEAVDDVELAEIDPPQTAVANAAVFMQPATAP